MSDIDRVRLCCGKVHTQSDVICDDGKVMCCLCFRRFEITILNFPNGNTPEDVCIWCAYSEKFARYMIDQVGKPAAREWAKSGKFDQGEFVYDK